MNRKGFTPIMMLLIVVGILVVGGILYYNGNKFISVLDVNNSNATSTPIVSIAPDSIVSTTGSIHIPISDGGFGAFPKFPIINKATGDSITIQADDAGSGQNPASYLFVNQKKIGVIGGYFSMPSFSHDNHYFAIRGAFSNGCCSTGYQLYVINIASNTIVTIAAHPYDAIIDSYSWGSGSTIDLTMYSVSQEIKGNDYYYYRTSPIEKWQYDLMTGLYPNGLLISSST